MWPSKLYNRAAAFTAVSALCIAAIPFKAQAQSSFLDTDFFCVNFGCAVVHDGDNFDIYDNFMIGINRCCVPIGAEMIPFTTLVTGTNLTGTLDRSDNARPGANQSLQFGITDSPTSVNFIDDGDGFLDASDSLSAFRLNSNTDLRLEGTGRQYSHSFFITSRNTRFSLRALASIGNVSGDFAQTVQLGDIKLTPSFVENGNDAGFSFGGNASSGNVQIVSGVDDLGDLTGLPTQIINFGRLQGIRQNNGSINEQTIRLDFLYELPQYDLSMGIGSMNVDVEFNFFREQ
ncbi:MAG: hypothetical protein ABJG88_10795 [Litorimonas sp.]